MSEARQAVARRLVRRVRHELQLAQDLERCGNGLARRAGHERGDRGAHHLLTPPVRGAGSRRPSRGRHVGVVGHQERQVREEAFGQGREQRSPSAAASWFARSTPQLSRRRRGGDAGPTAAAPPAACRTPLLGAPGDERDGRGVRVVQAVRHDAVLQLADHLSGASSATSDTSTNSRGEISGWCVLAMTSVGSAATRAHGLRPRPRR